MVLALLVLAFAPDRPTVLCIEEIERGIHPRLLRDVRDLLYRLSFPEDSGDTAPAVQVITTTHSPYILDLFANTPEDVILATRSGELSDAASALDWVQSIHPEAQSTWIAGYSFGALIGMQLLMRRPEVRGFISVAPPANMYDFSFLAPCPASGIFVQGAADTVVQPIAVQKLVDKLRTQKHITIHHEEIPRANHFFENEIEELMGSVDNYLDFRLSPDCPIK